MDIKRNLRKWIALLIAILCYFIIHEGAHWAYAVFTGTFKQINFIGIGIQIDIYRELMSDTQLGIFCLAGPVSTIITGYILLAFTQKFLLIQSAFLRAFVYYFTLVCLLVDPLYLSVLYSFVGGGDMNGIRLIMPEMLVRVIACIILVVNCFIILLIVNPKYRKAYQMKEKLEEEQ